jgi:hypothetical protein
MKTEGIWRVKKYLFFLSKKKVFVSLKPTTIPYTFQTTSDKLHIDLAGNIGESFFVISKCLAGYSSYCCCDFTNLICVDHAHSCF